MEAFVLLICVSEVFLLPWLCCRFVIVNQWDAELRVERNLALKVGNKDLFSSWYTKMHLFRCKISSLINKYECSAVLLWPSHVEHSHPARGSCAVGTAPDYGCRVRLSAVPAMLNSLDRGSYAFIFDSAWLFFLALTIIFLLKISLCFHLAPTELWDRLHAMK